MKLAIIGSRNFSNRELLVATLLRHYGPYDIISKKTDWSFSEIISGGAKGADSLGASFAREAFIPLVEHLPDWDKHGKSAGFIRNELIIKDADEILAFWDGVSRGTAHSLRLAKAQKKPTLIVYF